MSSVLSFPRDALPHQPMIRPVGAEIRKDSVSPTQGRCTTSQRRDNGASLCGPNKRPRGCNNQWRPLGRGSPPSSPLQPPDSRPQEPPHNSTHLCRPLCGNCQQGVFTTPSNLGLGGGGYKEMSQAPTAVVESKSSSVSSTCTDITTEAWAKTQTIKAHHQWRRAIAAEDTDPPTTRRDECLLIPSRQKQGP